MAAACFPEAQKVVQKQIDSIVGQDRCKICVVGENLINDSSLTVPVFDDMDDLTEVTAFILESYRWRPVSAGGNFFLK